MVKTRRTSIMVTKLIVSRELADFYIEEVGMKEEDFIISEPVKTYPKKKNKKSFVHIKSKGYGRGNQLRGQRIK